MCDFSRSILIINKNLGPVMSEVPTYANAIILTKAAKILHRHKLDYKCKYEGNLYETSVYDSWPPICLHDSAWSRQSLNWGLEQLQLTWLRLRFFNTTALPKIMWTIPDGIRSILETWSLWNTLILSSLMNFGVHKTNREFSGLAIDQTHEQANAVVWKVMVVPLSLLRIQLHWVGGWYLDQKLAC